MTQAPSTTRSTRQQPDPGCYRERELSRLTSNLEELVRDAVRTPVRAGVDVGEAAEEEHEERTAHTREERAKR